MGDDSNVRSLPGKGQQGVFIREPDICLYRETSSSQVEAVAFLSVYM